MAGNGEIIMAKPAWLPDELTYDGNWEEFIECVYQVFKKDFMQTQPSYQGYIVTCDTKIIDGKEVGFWHIVQREDYKLKERLPDLRRCCRISWPKPIIENNLDPALSVWCVYRKKPGSPRQKRVLIWLEELDYLVVLAERKHVIVLVTAYCTDIESHKNKLRKERDAYYEMQKPPGWAT
jgi:hypothetical protein